MIPSDLERGRIDLSHPDAIPFHRVGDRFYLDYEESSLDPSRVQRLAPVREEPSAERAEENAGYEEMPEH